MANVPFRPAPGLTCWARHAAGVGRLDGGTVMGSARVHVLRRVRRIVRQRGRVGVLLLSVASLVAVGISVAPTAAAAAVPVPAHQAVAPKPGDFGSGASTSADVAVNGFGDAAGYHLELGRESSGFAWREIAVLRPDGYDDGSWTGYQCVSGDGKDAAVAILPGSAVNIAAARDHGGFAYSVNLASGAVHAIAAGVGLKYYSPGCGVGDDAVFTVDLDGAQQTTRLLTANLASGKVTGDVTAAGQVTSAVPTAQGPVGVTGGQLVRIPATGKPVALARLNGSMYDLRPAADGGVNFLDTKAGSATAQAFHVHTGTVTTLGSGALTRLQLFGGRSGHAVLSGAKQTTASALTSASVRAVSDAGLPDGAQIASLDGDALFGASANVRQTTPQVLATRTAKVLSDAQAKPAAKVTSALPAFRIPVSDFGAAPTQGGTPQPHGDAAPSKAAVAPKTVTPKVATAQTPTCSVPRLDPTKQVMQPAPAQVDWAVQMAEQGLLTGAAYTRPAGFDNLGLAAYAPSSDFPLISLDHPSGGGSTVPRSVFEAIMAQESNWSQASWHATKGVAGDPLIADYYGAGGGIDTIDYANADCGYGISQVTTGMRNGDHEFSAHGQIKVAVDYQENIAAGLQILESTWNQLYTAGIIANNGDPSDLENWYFAAWAYNTGIQPNAANGNTTGCTPGPTCTGPDGTWGLGWTNNPDNLDYPPNRDPFLQDTYADAAHPADWPYQERVLGWMAQPLLRYSNDAYSRPTYHGGNTWMQIPPAADFCVLSQNNCDPNNVNTSNPGASHCMLNDFECWWHQPVTWVSSCATTCATSAYQFTTGSTEPSNPDAYPPSCSVDRSVVAGNAIIVDDQSSLVNLQGCGSSNWSDGGSFTYAYGTDSAGDPIGAIDTHQLGSGLGGHILFSHTETGSNPNEINTGTWTPNLPSLQYYKIKIHFPALGAAATNVVYTINPGGGVSPWKIRVNQAWNSEQWATIGTFAMENGANVVLTNQSADVDTTGTDFFNFDVAFDAIAFVPMGGTPGQPLGGPPGVQDEPRGSNPAFIQCGCAQRTAGDPVDTSTGYFGDTFTDLSTPGRGAPLDFTRTYTESTADPNGPNGSLAVDGPFGWGWNYSYGLFAATDPTTGNVTVHQEDGSQVTFIDSSGSYAPSAPRYDATLTTSGTNYVFTRHGQEIFTFDTSSGHLLSEQDLAGTKASTPYATTMAYDSSGHLHTITDPAGRTYTLTWIGSHITQLADSAGRVVTYAYDGNDNLTDVYGVGTTRSPSLLNDDHAQFGYAAGHLMTSMRSPTNFGGASTAVTSMTYDTSERVLTQTDPNSHTTTFTYGPNGGLAAGQTLVTDPAGHKTLDTYAGGLLTSEVKGYGTSDAGTWTYTYDPISLGISTETDPDGNVQTFTYDDHDNKASESNALGFTTNYEYDANSNLVETIDPNGVATVNQYDQSGHIPSAATGVDDLTSTTVTQANNVVESTTGNFGPAPTRTTNFYYDDAAHPADRTRAVDANTNTTTTTYDAFGDVAMVTDPKGDKTAYGYDTSRGLRTSEVDPNGTAAGVTPGCTPPAKGCSTFGHDAYGDVTSVTDPLGDNSTATFDADGNKTSATDANHSTVTTTFDPADQAVQTTQADNTTQVTDYNPDGTTADTVDGLSHKTSYGYDGQGRQDSRTDPDNRTTGSHIDPAGLVLTATDATGRVTTMGYDPAGELTSVSYSDGVTPGVSYGYDPDGNRVSMTDGTGTTSWTYDTFNEVTVQTQGSGTTVQYGYDNDGDTTSITYPGQTTPVQRGFDAADRLTSVTDFAGNKTTFGYDSDSSVLTTSYPNGTTVTNGYDNREAQTSTTAVTGPTTVLSAGYGYDPTGQLNSQTVGAVSRSFAYTPREQLASDTSGGTTAGYAQDAANNPTTVGANTQAFDPAGQECWSTTSTVANPSCGTVPTGATTYTFDGIGERTAATPASGTASTYGYNQAGQLKSFSGPNGSATYAYDGTGLRVAKTAGGVTSTFTWDNEATPNILTDGTEDYLYGPDGLPIEQVGSSSTQWFVHDQLGSTLCLLNTAGAVVGSYTYSAYGTAAHSGTTGTPLQYTGQYTDTESGLVYLRARYYDPATAQFLTVDPLVGQTQTPYAYVGGDPVNGTDLDGRCGWSCWTIEIVGNLGMAGQDAAEEVFSGGVASVGVPAENIAEEALIDELAHNSDGSGDNWVVGQDGDWGGGGSSTLNMVGDKGTKTHGSITVWNKGQYRIDVENMAPGKRPGNMHFQDQSGKVPKCYFNFKSGQFDGLPNKLAQQLQKDPSFQRGINQGKKILGQ